MISNVKIYFWPVTNCDNDRAIVYIFHGETTHIIHASKNNTFTFYHDLTINLEKTIYADADKERIHDIYTQSCGFVLCNNTSQLHMLHQHAQASIEIGDIDQCRPSIFTTCNNVYAAGLREELQSKLEKHMVKVSVVPAVIRPINKWVFYNATCSTYAI